MVYTTDVSLQDRISKLNINNEEVKPAIKVKKLFKISDNLRNLLNIHVMYDRLSQKQIHRKLFDYITNNELIKDNNITIESAIEENIDVKLNDDIKKIFNLSENVIKINDLIEIINKNKS